MKKYILQSDLYLKLCIALGLSFFGMNLTQTSVAQTNPKQDVLSIDAGMACRENAPERLFAENGADYWLQLGSSRVKIIGRASWGALPAIIEGRSWKTYSSKQPFCQWIKRITVHHTHGDYTVQSLQKFHQNIEDPKADIAYHFFINEKGVIYEGRPLGFMGSHSEADNSFNVGIALNGNFEAKAPRHAQLNALKNLLQALHCPCFTQDGIWTHRQRKTLNFPEQPEHWTTCPGDQLHQKVHVFAENQNLLPPLAETNITKKEPSP